MNNIKEIYKLFTMAGKVKLFLILTLLRCPFDALYSVVLANFLQYAFNIIDKGTYKDLFSVCILFGIGSLLLFLYNGTMWTLYANYVIKWVGRIRKKLFEHISRLSLQQIEAKTSGEWITRLNTDVNTATALLNQAIHLPHAVVASVNICVTTIILVWINPKIYGLILLFTIPHILLNQIFIARPMIKFSIDVQEAIAKNTTDMNTFVTCAEMATLYDAHGFLLRNFEESSNKIRRANMKIQHRRALGNGLVPLMGLGGYLLILLMGGSWIIAGTMSFGALTAVFQYRGGLQKSLMMFIDSLVNINTAMAGVKRVNETMCIELED